MKSVWRKIQIRSSVRSIRSWSAIYEMVKRHVNIEDDCGTIELYEQVVADSEDMKRLDELSPIVDGVWDEIETSVD